jgi:hypothetical protein
MPDCRDLEARYSRRALLEAGLGIAAALTLCRSATVVARTSRSLVSLCGGPARVRVRHRPRKRSPLTATTRRTALSGPQTSKIPRFTAIITA